MARREYYQRNKDRIKKKRDAKKKDAKIEKVTLNLDDLRLVVKEIISQQHQPIPQPQQ